jgi:hypothetical protein
VQVTTAYILESINSISAAYILDTFLNRSALLSLKIINNESSSKGTPIPWAHYVCTERSEVMNEKRL